MFHQLFSAAKGSNVAGHKINQVDVGPFDSLLPHPLANSPLSAWAFLKYLLALSYARRNIFYTKCKAKVLPRGQVWLRIVAETHRELVDESGVEGGAGPAVISGPWHPVFVGQKCKELSMRMDARRGWREGIGDEEVIHV
jgi:hypothetical protein